MRTGTEVKSIGPLTSWDIFMQGYRHAQQLADDRSMLERMAKEWQWDQTFDYRYHLFQLQKTILVTSASQEIVFASSNIYTMNGYTPKEVVGRTPRMFQGPETRTDSRAYVREAIVGKQPFESTILNYRKDGSIYNCHINGFPLLNKNKKLVHFIAFENIV